jgi:5'-nucleotidase
MYQETVYNDPVETTQEMVHIEKEQQCDVVICLSHLGYNYKNDPSICDVKLAELTKGY